MIKNLWRKMIARSNMTQNSFADAVGIPPPTMSMIVKGFAAPMTLEQANEMCAVLGCKLTDVYTAGFIREVYGCAEESEKPKPKKLDTRVRLSAGVWLALLDKATNLGMDTSQYANHLLLERLGIDDA